jgi:hypothetical protein
MSITVKTTNSILALVLTLLLPAVVHADVKATLDRYQAYEGDQLTLTIETNNRNAPQPDLTPLSSDFRILGTRTGTSVRIVNGVRSDKITWRIGLEPRKLGRLQVPSLRVGQEQTPPLELTVREIPAEIKEQQARQLFIETEIEPRDKYYVQQQISLKVRLLHDGSLVGGELAEPKIGNALVERLGDEVRYTTTRHGRPYTVIERRYVILPERSGELQIPAVRFEGKVNAPAALPDMMQQGNSLLNDFFGSSPFRAQGRQVRIESEPATVQILPRPDGLAGNWLPAEEIRLFDSWTENPPQLRAGEPVTRTITVEARGLTGSQIPVLEPGQPADTRLYPEQPVMDSRTDGNKVFGFSRQSFTYIPDRAGKLRVPPVELAWWNVEKDQEGLAQLSEWDLNVAPGSGATARPPVQSTPPDNTGNASSTGTTTESPTPLSESSETSLLGRYWWLLVLLLVFPLLYLLARKKSTAPRKEVTPDKPAETLVSTERPQTAFRSAIERLERACRENRPTDAASALLSAAEATWPDDPPRTLGALAARFEDVDAGQVMLLDRALYAGEASEWNGMDLLNAVRDAWKPGNSEKRVDDEILEPLYPQR